MSTDAMARSLPAWSRAWRSPAAVAFLLLSALLAGCSGGKFEETAPTWQAGFRWEYLIEEVEREGVTGTVPSFLVEEFPGGFEEHMCNRTRRLEVFNTTLVAEEGIPLYAAGVLEEPVAGDADSSRCYVSGQWRSTYYTRANVNEVRAQHENFVDETVRVGDAGERDEESLFRFPLTNGKQWTEPIEDDEAGGTLTYQVVKREHRNVPAGGFDAVRIFARAVPEDISELEDEIRDFFDSQDASLSTLEFDLGIRKTYWYAAAASYLVEMENVGAFIIHAAGTEEGGEGFDFTFEESETERWRLNKYELSPGLERPLSFLAELREYEPPPITPLGNFVPEIVVSADGLNVIGNADEPDPRVEFRLRVYNTTAGEEPMRPANQRYPVVAPSNDYDEQRIDANWSFHRETPEGLVPLREDRGSTASLQASEVPGAGLYRVTVTLFDTENQQDLASDSVLFEVYWRQNLTVEATTDNATNRYVHTMFPVDVGTKQVEVLMRFSDASSHPFGEVRVFDADGQRVFSEGGGRAHFYASALENYIPGQWEARFVDTPVVVGATYTFDVSVRHRPPEFVLE